MEVYHGWIIAGILFLVWEVLTPGFVVANFGLGCFAAAAADYGGAGLAGQLAAFGGVSLLGFIFVRPFFKKFIYRFSDQRKLGVEALPGRIGRVVEAIDSGSSRGRVRLGGEEWQAASASGRPIEPGRAVRVVRVEGVTLYVDLDEEGGE